MKRSHAIASIMAISLLGAATYVIQANSQTENHQMHSNHSVSNDMETAPTEAGQSAFAAIAEIVQLLNADPKTDWAKVNITRLRDHLVDMNELTMNAKVVQKTMGNEIRFEITGDVATVAAIKNMVPAHAAELNKTTKWNAVTDENENGVTLSMKMNDKSELQKVQALGFFGVMATGAHHQPHHLAMARGLDHGH